MHAIHGAQVELASWLGADVVRSMLLAKMPDAMRKDTEKLVEEAPRKQHPARLTRKEAAARARTAAVDGSAGGAGTPGAAAGLSAPQQNGLQGQEDSVGAARYPSQPSWPPVMGPGTPPAPKRVQRIVCRSQQRRGCSSPHA